MSRHYSSRSYGGYGSSRRRTGADRFGILTFFLLLISSGFLAARLLTTGVLTQKLTLLLLSVLAVALLYGTRLLLRHFKQRQAKTQSHPSDSEAK